MLSPQDRAELARIERERKAREKRKLEAKKRENERLQRLNDIIMQNEMDKQQEEYEDQQNDEYDDNDISQDIQDEIDRIKERNNKSKDTEDIQNNDNSKKDSNADSLNNKSKNDLNNGQTSPNDPAREAGRNNAPNKPQNGVKPGNNAGGATTPGGPTAGGANGATAAGNVGGAAGSGTAATTSGAAAGGTAAGAGGAAAGAGGAAAGGAGGAAAGGAAAGAPVILIVLLVIVIFILLISIAGFLLNSSIFTGADTYDYNFTVDNTTVAQIINARETKLKKPLLRFGVRNKKVLFFFTVADSEMRDLIYNNMNGYYDEIVKEMDQSQVSSIASGKAEKLSSVGEAITVKVKSGTNEANELNEYKSSGFSIKNYLLFLENDEFTNSFMSDTLSARTVKETYDDMLSQENTNGQSDKGDSKLSSITDGFRFLIQIKYGQEKAKELFGKEGTQLSNAELDNIKNQKKEYADLYLEYLKTDLTFSLIYKYLFCTVEQFNSIIWNAYEADRTNGTFKEMNFWLEQYKNTDNTYENLYIPKVYLDNKYFYNREQYERYIDEIISVINPYLMHWVVPYSLNVATGDYTFALDVMYNMKGPIKLDVFKVEKLQRNEDFCIAVNRNFENYDVLFECPECGSNEGVYTYEELLDHAKKHTKVNYSSITENTTDLSIAFFNSVIDYLKPGTEQTNALKERYNKIISGELQVAGSCETEKFYNAIRDYYANVVGGTVAENVNNNLFPDYGNFMKDIAGRAGTLAKNGTSIPGEAEEHWLAGKGLENYVIKDIDVYRDKAANDKEYRDYCSLIGYKGLCSKTYPLNNSMVIEGNLSDYGSYGNPAQITFYWIDPANYEKDSPTTKTYEELKAMKCIKNGNATGTILANSDHVVYHLDNSKDDKSSSYKTKVKYAEGMYKVTYNEWNLIPYDVDQNKGLQSRETNIDETTGEVKVSSVFEDSLDMGAGHYDKTYKLSYLKPEDYNSDGTRKDTNEKISRIEWFLDYGSGDNEMFPDKRDTNWYSMYDVEYEGVGKQNTFASFYHISFKEINKVKQLKDANGNVLSDDAINDSTATDTVKNYLKENFCKYIELKYKENIKSLNELLDSEQFKNNLQSATSSQTEVSTQEKFKYVNKNYPAYTFEIVSVADQTTMNNASLNWSVTNAWNYYCGNKIPTNNTGYYGDPSNLNPLIDACYRLNTVQGYDYKNLDSAFVEIEAYYRELPNFTSDMLGYNVVSEEIASLPSEGLKWPVSPKSSSSPALDWTHQNGSNKTIKINGGVNSNSRSDYNVISAIDGTVYIDNMTYTSKTGGKVSAQRVKLLSDDERYLIVYNGVSVANLKSGDKVYAGTVLGTVGMSEQTSDGKTQWYVEYEVAFDVEGFKKDTNDSPIYGTSQCYDPTIFYTFEEDGTITSVTGSSGEYAVRERKVGEKTLKYKVFKQEGAYYSNTYYGHDWTIGQGGCPLIATSNALSALGTSVDPGQLWAAVGAPAGAYGVSQGTDKYGYRSETKYASAVSSSSVIEHLKNGGSIVFHVPQGTYPFAKYGHWMSITDYNSASNTVLVNDGGYNTLDGYYSVNYILSITERIVFIYPK